MQTVDITQSSVTAQDIEYPAVNWHAVYTVELRWMDGSFTSGASLAVWSVGERGTEFYAEKSWDVPDDQTSPFFNARNELMDEVSENEDPTTTAKVRNIFSEAFWAADKEDRYDFNTWRRNECAELFDDVQYKVVEHFAQLSNNEPYDMPTVFSG